MRSGAIDQQVQPVRNIVPRPNPRSAGGSASTAYFSSSGAVATLTDIVAPDGSLGVRLTRVAEGAVALYTARGGSPLWPTQAPMVPGETWTVMYSARAGAEGTVINRVLGYGTGSQSFTTPGMSVVSTIGVAPVDLRAQLTFTEDMATIGNAFIKWNLASAVGTPGAAIGDWIEIWNVCVVKGIYTGPMIDGNQYGAIWLGTANASHSAMYPPSPNLIRNLHPSPSTPGKWRVGSAPTGSTGDIVQGIGGPNLYALEVTFASAPTSRPNIRSDVVTTESRTPVVAGQTYTFSAWSRYTWGCTQACILVQFYNSDGVIVGATYASTLVTAVAGRWIRHIHTRAAPTGAVSAALYVSSGNDYPAAGEKMAATNFMVNVGATVYDYCDGYTPGWRWEGVVGASSSIGYPYTLESLAGPPLVQIATPGTAVALNGLTHTGAMSMYQVIDKFLEPNIYSSGFSGVNSSAGGSPSRPTSFTFQNSTQANAAAMRVDTTALVNQAMSVANHTVGRHVTCGRLNQGMTTRKLSIDGRVPTAMTCNPGSGIERYQLRTDETDTYSSPVILYYYEAEHDDATAYAVQKWLANKHGFALAA